MMPSRAAAGSTISEPCPGAMVATGGSRAEQAAQALQVDAPCPRRAAR